MTNYELTVYKNGEVQKILFTEDRELVRLHTEGIDPSEYTLTTTSNDRIFINNHYR